MIGLRLLLGAARGGGSFTPPPSVVGTFELVPSTENAGWVEIPYPQVVTIGSRTFLGYVDGSNGDVNAAVYDGTTTLHLLHAALGGEGTADNHDTPAFIELDDGDVLTAYCRHAGSAILMRRFDGSSWGSETSLDRGNQHDYPSFFRVGSDIWLLYRNTTSGQNANLCWVVSSDEGATWSGSTNTPAVSVYNGTVSHTPYWRLWHDVATGFIHVVVTDLEPNTASKLGHFYINTADGKTYKTDGTEITATRPFLYASISAIDDGTAGSTQTWGVTMDAGNPVAIYMRHLSSDNAIRIARWTGSAWTTEQIVSTTNGQLGINKFGSGCAIDPLDPDRVWIPKKSTKFEIWEYRKAAGVWSGTQLTTGSSRDQVWVAATQFSDGTVDAAWLDIAYTDDTHFGPGGIVGYGTG